MIYFTKYICFYKLDKHNTLMLNTLTSALDVIDNSTLIKIQKIIYSNQKITNESDLKLFNKLKERGYIFNSQKDEQNLLNYFQMTNKKILSGTICTDFKICPTMGCNLRCTYCYQDHKIHGNFKVMSDIQLNTIFDYIKKCKNDMEEKIGSYNAIKIGLFGGEPLLKGNYKIVERVLEFAKKINTKVYITTNCTTISDYEKLFIKYKDIIRIQITFDGNKLNHDKRRIYSSGAGTFDEICKNINKILNIGIKTTARINVDKENIQELSELKSVFELNGWSKNSLFKTYATPIRNYENPVNLSEVLSDSEILDVFMKNGWYGKNDSFINSMDSSVYDVVKRIFKSADLNVAIPWQITYCSASQGVQYCFAPDGSISTCLKCVGNNDYKIGTFDGNGVYINDEKIKKWTNRDPFEIPKCRNCKFILLCAGGCPFYSLKNFKNINCGVCNDIEKTLEVYVNNAKQNWL